MSNGADNYVLTATGTDAMNAEANLQFDGTHLGIGGAAGLNKILHIQSTRNLWISDNASITSELGTSTSHNFLSFKSNNGSEYLGIGALSDSTGNVIKHLYLGFTYNSNYLLITGSGAPIAGAVAIGPNAYNTPITSRLNVEGDITVTSHITSSGNISSSGHIINTGNITSSGNISSSKSLFFSGSDLNSNTVLVYDTSSGKIHTTSSDALQITAPDTLWYDGTSLTPPFIS